MDRRKLLTAGLVLAGGAVAAGTAAAQAQSAQASSSSSDVSPATPPEARDAAAHAAQANQPVPAAPPSPPKIANFDWPNLHRYHQANAEAMALPASARRVVMMGDSITDNWAKPEFGNGFFDAHGIV